ncbi:hypothetical protein C8N32_11414 [Rhodovulum imhoffii]|uniref:DUF2169 domain-containing protein n=1 Tax=Rhodovulum imhoffii TaxID=365340 RepID=A0A2T5BQB6_9RHOB|nr:hypothetical protein [Rhodovulum imhoffii]MBK5933701.1 hypothetical protein [Rhodovulum imhoffii]PTN01315.1 hypothetical protein C8N32_11414 [Rhodovulum imhoffii]
MQTTLDLSLTTQGPLYPPSEVMDQDGNFIVIGALNRDDGAGGVRTDWGGAIVKPDSALPDFGARAPYDILREFGPEIPEDIADSVLHTLPLPLPCTNYPMLFAPDQYPQANSESRPSYPFHDTPIPDALPEHGRARTTPIRLREWATARGQVTVTVTEDQRAADFDCTFAGLLPGSLYTIMTLRAHDLDPDGPTRPGPLGIPNVFVTDAEGRATFHARLPDPFPDPARPGANRVINIVVLWMSYQQSHGGAIGRYGLGGDIHAQLKLRGPSFDDLRTIS